MILLDTNVISEWMKVAPDPEVIAWLDHQRPSQLYISAVTKAEIERGISHCCRTGDDARHCV